MSLAVLYSRALSGMEAALVTVEVHIANGLPNFTIVGLPETEVKESKDRVRAALQNCQFDFPARRITVNLAPADLPKESGRFDLPIALGILAATGQIPSGKLAEYEYAGELALTGELRPIRGALAMDLSRGEQRARFYSPASECRRSRFGGRRHRVCGTIAAASGGAPHRTGTDRALCQPAANHSAALPGHARSEGADASQARA